MPEGSKEKSCTVVFLPERVETSVSAGTTVIDAARRAGVYVNSLCAGDGVCGKCRVIVRLGEVLGGSAEFFTREEIQQGYVLACQAEVLSDVVIEIPELSRIQGKPVVVDTDAERFSEMSVALPDGIKVDPLVRKYHLRLTAPTLDDNSSDLDRLKQALRQAQGEAEGKAEFQMGLKVIKTLPVALRSGKWDVTATVARRGPLTEIVRIETGDASGANLGLAVDIGTTTVVAHLVDTAGGKILGWAAKYNSQITYGADVIRRILWAESNPNGVQALQEVVVNDINGLIAELEQRCHVSRNEINVVVVAGNTTMTHLFLGINPANIRRPPFVGATYSPPPFRAVELGLQTNPRGLVYCLPMVASFVGGDVTAGVLATDLDRLDGLNMLIDMGTNGEIVIGNKDWLVCASASAGPAFEGSETRDGVRTQAGAVDHVKLLNRDRFLSLSTVGGSAPIGVCGTGYIDLLAELLRHGVMDRTGRIDLLCGSRRVAGSEQHEARFVVAYPEESGTGREIAITQYDIENMLRAKAAIYAATRVLLGSLGLDVSRVERIFIAGGFGNYLDMESAITIGLLPDVPVERVKFVGNGSITGAKMCMLSSENYQRARRTAARMTYFELGTDSSFMDEFLAAKFFPHTDIQKFPSVCAKLNLGR